MYVCVQVRDSSRQRDYYSSVLSDSALQQSLIIDIKRHMVAHVDARTRLSSAQLSQRPDIKRKSSSLV